MHPYLPQHELLEFCTKNGVQVTAYSPLGSDPKNGVLTDPTVASIAKTHEKTPAQVLIAWALQRGTIVIPKSANPTRITENYDAKDVHLTAEEMRVLDDLYKVHGRRYVDPKSFWKVDVFSKV